MGFPLDSNKWIKLTRFHILEKIKCEEEKGNPISITELYQHFNVKKGVIVNRIRSLYGDKYANPLNTFTGWASDINGDSRWILGAAAKSWLKYHREHTFLSERHAGYIAKSNFIDVASKKYVNKKRIDYV
jgi:hypothetical protein